jgi:hypothetical protein
LVVTGWQTEAGEPMSLSGLLLNFAVRKWSRIGPVAAAATMPTATRTQAATMIVPRRRSAAFCWARICSTTF